MVSADYDEHDDGSWKGDGLLESQDNGQYDTDNADDDFDEFSDATSFSGVYAGPVTLSHGSAPLGPDGNVVDTPEVAEAKVAHFAARAAAIAATTKADNDNYKHAAVPAFKPPYKAPAVFVGYGPDAAPVGLDGNVVDTPEVSKAKAFHFAAKNAATNGPKDYQSYNFAPPIKSYADDAKSFNFVPAAVKSYANAANDAKAYNFAPTAIKSYANVAIDAKPFNFVPAAINSYANGANDAKSFNFAPSAIKSYSNAANDIPSLTFASAAIKSYGSAAKDTSFNFGPAPINSYGNAGESALSFNFSPSPIKSYSNTAKDIPSFNFAPAPIKSFGSATKDASTFKFAPSPIKSYTNAAKDVSTFNFAPAAIKSFGSIAKDAKSFNFAPAATSSFSSPVKTVPYTAPAVPSFVPAPLSTYPAPASYSGFSYGSSSLGFDAGLPTNTNEKFVPSPSKTAESKGDY